MTQVAAILRKATRKENDRINVVSFPCHERYQSGLEEVNAEFYLVHAPNVKTWNSTYAPLPKNHHLLLDGQLPSWVDFDLVLSQNKFGQFPIAKEFAGKLSIPLISLEHTLPVPTWSQTQLDQFKTLRGDTNVFISNFSKKAWGWEKDEAEVVEHGINVNVFRPLPKAKKRQLISVANDLINRDWCLNYSGWKRITEGLPVRILGDTPGLSKPAQSINHLVSEYNESLFFLNTTTYSPIPTVILEAMSCGLPIISTATCMIPDIIENNVNGFISNDESVLKHHCKRLLDNPDECRRLGENARRTIVEKFPLSKFVQNWDDLLRKTANAN